MNKIFFLIIVNLLINNTLIAQSNWQIKTIYLHDLKSKDIPLFSTKDSVVEILGNPDFIQEKNISICDSIIRNKKIISKIKINILYYSNKQIQYIENDNKIRLVFIDFKLNNTAEIICPQISFNRSLRLKEILKTFQLSKKEDVYVLKWPFPPPWNYATNKTEKAYRITFFTGEPCDTVIEIYFDKKKKLRYIYINPYYF